MIANGESLSQAPEAITLTGAFCVPGGRMLVAADLDQLVSAREAATHTGLAVQTIHSWVQRGYLQPSGLDNKGHKLYKLIDVLKVARDTRKRALGNGRLA